MGTSISSSSMLSLGQQNYLSQKSALASTLFGSLDNSSNILGNYSISDYSSIKNGSYGKLLSSYYKKQLGTSDKSSSKSSSAEKARELTKYEKEGTLDKILAGESEAKTAAIENKKAEETKSNASTAAAAGSLKGAIDTLNKLETSDMDEAAKAVQKFTDSYNQVVKAASSSPVSAVQRNLTWMTGATDSMKNSLEKAGITVGKDKMLSFDAETFKKADESIVNKLFAADDANTIYADSYVADISKRADAIYSLAGSNGTSQSGYTQSGSYSAASTGTTFNTGI